MQRKAGNSQHAKDEATTNAAETASRRRATGQQHDEDNKEAEGSLGEEKWQFWKRR
jgi:hypothetical protein